MGCRVPAAGVAMVPFATPGAAGKCHLGSGGVTLFEEVS